MGRNYIKTFSKGSNYKDYKLPSGSSPGTPQSMAILPGDVIAVFHNESNAGRRAYCRKYTKSGYQSGSSVVNNNLGHCNGATYCEKNGLIYCTGYNNGSDSKQIVVMNTNFKQQFTFNLPVSISGIAYDKTVNKFYCSKGGNVYVFPYSAFTKTNRTTAYKKFSVKGGTGQDIGGYNGIIYRVMWHNSYGDIDLYQHTDGKYIGSIKVTFSETESCCFDSNGYFIYLTAKQNRAIHWTKWKPQYKCGNVTTTPGNKEGKAPTAFVATAKNEVGTKESPMGSNHVKYSTWYNGKDEAWCSEFVVWCAWKTFGSSYQKVIPKHAAAHGLQEAIVNKCGGSWVLKGSFAKNAASAAKCKPGDIFTTDKDHNGVANHVGIIEKVSGTTIYTIEGNHGDKVAQDKRSISGIFRVARPKWPDGSFSMPGGYDEGFYGEEGGQMGPFAHPDQLYSSANYEYQTEKEETEAQKAIRAQRDAYRDFLRSININGSFNNNPPPDIVLPSIRAASNYRKPKTKLDGEVPGSHLPSTINFVEAPYAKITLGGVEFGTYRGGKFPNYIQGVNVKKTNGSLNEYTVNLLHQVAPGDNPNYIENLISANGYNVMNIEYGDAEAGIAYRSINALLTDVKSKYDFFNSSISYTLSATSSSVMSSVNRRNYPAVNDKPSNIINKMLYETKELLQYFPAMSNKTLVSSSNYIPTNDKKVEIDAVENTTPLNYLNKLVSSMVSTTSGAINDSIYYLDINDENSLGPYFTINEVKTKMSTSMFPLIYEVDINYPDEQSLVYNFSVNTDYAWPLAYQYGGDFTTYDYNIDNTGQIITQASNSAIKSTRGTSNSFITDKNWWTNVTEFPITATLEVKGLTSYILLLNYIKVNVYYFGNKRDSSGIYIVTGQEDILSGNGFRTKLDLMRVAGDNQHITVDGRVIS